MIEKIYDNPEIYKIEIPLRGNALRVLNSYVIRSRGKVLVVDTGFRKEDCKKALQEGLDQLGLEAADCGSFLHIFILTT